MDWAEECDDLDIAQVTYGGWSEPCEAMDWAEECDDLDIAQVTYGGWSESSIINSQQRDVVECNHDGDDEYRFGESPLRVRGEYVRKGDKLFLPFATALGERMLRSEVRVVPEIAVCALQNKRLVALRNEEAFNCSKTFEHKPLHRDVERLRVDHFLEVFGYFG